MVDPITTITTVTTVFTTATNVYEILSTTQNPLRTSVTIVFENKCSFSLIHPTKYCASGKDVDPPSPTISPGSTIAAKFEGGNGTKGMLCYQIGESSGPENDRYYLLIMWKVKRFSQNKFYMCLYESKEPSLSGNSKQKKSFYKSMKKMYEPSYDEIFLEGKKLRVGGTMSSNDSAKIKIFLENHKPPKKSLLRKIWSFLTKKFRKKKPDEI